MHPDITRHLRTRSTRWAAGERWVAAKLAALRKPYTRPEVRIGPRDEEDVIEALCALNPYM